MINNRITANEARAFIDGNWKSKLEEIYNGVRANGAALFLSGEEIYEKFFQKI